MEKAVDPGRRVSKSSAGGKLEGEQHTTGRVGLASRRASRKKWRVSIYFFVKKIK